MPVSQVEKTIKPLRKELKPKSDKKKEAKKFVEALSKRIKVLCKEADVLLGGSIAKDTYLPDDFDVDIFVRFPEEYNDTQISEMTKKALEKISKDIKVLHGSRDYYQVQKDLKYEIVPVTKVKKGQKARNVADMSPLHVQYFLKKSNKKIVEDIRIAKKFLKSARIYGAESHIGGFSGHVVDLLIIHYGSFEKMVEAVSKWKTKTIIDTEKHHGDPLFSINSSKTMNPLVVVDPVDPGRNAAAAVTKEAYDKLRKTCKNFLKEPSKQFFESKPFMEEIEKVSASKQVIIRAVPLDGKEDVVYSKILKIKEYLERALKEEGFTIKKSDWNQKDTIIIAVKEAELPEYKETIGPTLEMDVHIEEFKRSHERIREEDGRLIGEDRRTFTTLREHVELLIQTPYVKTKCKAISIIRK